MPRCASAAAIPIHTEQPFAGRRSRFTIGLGDVDDVLLKRMANDPSLSPNPVANGRQGRYVYAADATALDLAFTRVASEILRLAK